jgi:tetratricopeptide (TPR) repeat protein
MIASSRECQQGEAGMQRITRTHFLILVAALALATAGCNKLSARDKLNKGVHAYKAGNMEGAIELFKEAKELDPDLLNARLYLATAYASQYIPGAPSPENTRNGEAAVKEFKDVLVKDANNLSAIDGLGSILSNMAGNPFKPELFDESKTYHKKHISLKGDDPDPYYWIGFINWTIAYRSNDALRAEYNKNARRPIKGDEPMPDKVREEFSQKNAALIEEGIENLNKAVMHNPDYASAYAYLNLLYRQKADLSGSADEREQLLTQADNFVEKYKVIKQKELEKAAAGVPAT